MTDSEKLDLLLETVVSIDKRVASVEEKVDSMDKRIASVEEKVVYVEEKVGSLKYQLMKNKAELKAMDEMILDEVERVHGILDRHKSDQTVHTA